MTKNPESAALTSLLTADVQADCSSTDDNLSHDQSGASSTISMVADSTMFSAVSSTSADNGGDNQNSTDKTADEKYRERRNRNNAAAKRSRDTKQAKLDSQVIHASLLEQENKRLREEKKQLQKEILSYRAELDIPDQAYNLIHHQPLPDHKYPL
ncbi:basic leucine zipper transcriptional factor ATF-like [Watersipora subatra]|uniref:basic leucine zipper transcriptional factor ATF-like n=1 Tax=Watersipora subatra TaxID=2589382 RepID=UPI00355B2FDC